MRGGAGSRLQHMFLSEGGNDLAQGALGAASQSGMGLAINAAAARLPVPGLGNIVGAGFSAAALYQQFGTAQARADALKAFTKGFSFTGKTWALAIADFVTSIKMIIDLVANVCNILSGLAYAFAAIAALGGLLSVFCPPLAVLVPYIPMAINFGRACGGIATICMTVSNALSIVPPFFRAIDVVISKDDPIRVVNQEQQYHSEVQGALANYGSAAIDRGIATTATGRKMTNALNRQNQPMPTPKERSINPLAQFHQGVGDGWEHVQAMSSGNRALAHTATAEQQTQRKQLTETRNEARTDAREQRTQAGQSEREAETASQDQQRQEAAAQQEAQAAQRAQAAADTSEAAAQQQRDAATREHEAFDREQAALGAEQDALAREQRAAGSENDELTARQKALKERRTALAERKQALADREQRQGDLDAQRKRQQEAIGRARSRRVRQQARQALDSTRSQLAAAERRTQAAQAEADQATAQADAAERAAIEQQQVVAEAQARVDQAQTRAAGAESRVDDARTRADAAERLAQGAEREARTARQQSTDAGATAEQARRDADAAARDAQQARVDASDARTRADAARATARDARRAIRDGNKPVDDYQQEDFARQRDRGQQGEVGNTGGPVVQGLVNSAADAVAGKATPSQGDASTPLPPRTYDEHHHVVLPDPPAPRCTAWFDRTDQEIEALGQQITAQHAVTEEAAHTGQQATQRNTQLTALTTQVVARDQAHEATSQAQQAQVAQQDADVQSQSTTNNQGISQHMSSAAGVLAPISGPAHTVNSIVQGVPHNDFFDPSGVQHSTKQFVDNMDQLTAGQTTQGHNNQEAQQGIQTRKSQAATAATTRAASRGDASQLASRMQTDAGTAHGVATEMTATAAHSTSTTQQLEQRRADMQAVRQTKWQNMLAWASQHLALRQQVADEPPSES